MMNDSQSVGAQEFDPPSTIAIPVKDTLHDVEVIDNYRWLEDKNRADVKEWTHLQHEATLRYMDAAMPSSPILRKIIEDYLEREVVGAPFFVKEHEFFYKKDKGAQQSKLMIREAGLERAVFDPLAIDPTGKTSLSGTSFTKDGRRVAVATQYKGSEITDWRILDVQAGQQEGEIIRGVWNFSWTVDEEHAYISFRTNEIVEKQLPINVYRWKIGSPLRSAEQLTNLKDAKNTAYVYDSDADDSPYNLTYVSEGDFYSSILYCKKAGTNAALVKIFSGKSSTARPYLRNGKLYFYTNDKAPNFKIMVAELSNPVQSAWKTLIPEGETVLTNYVLTSDFLLVQDKKDLLSRLRVYTHEGNYIRDLALPLTANVSWLQYNRDRNIVFATLSTFDAPSVVYALDGKSLEWTLFYTQQSPLNTVGLQSELVFYPSKDGTKIPMFLLYNEKTLRNGESPVKLYGYGGFNNGISPSYVGLNSLFIQSGGVLAIAGIRGGNEYGEQWHLDGMLKNKQNVFNDFIAGAEYLIREGWTNPQKLVIDGRSNGGLLIGAVATQRPELFKAAICGVPLLDMIRYHKFLIARYWLPEYGDPDAKDDFEYIVRYSPYHNIDSAVNHPAMFVFAGENDVRVDPLHAKKFVAALQNNSMQKNPIMLYMEFDSGHGAGKSVKQQTKDYEMQLRFLFLNLGMKFSEMQ